MRKILFFPILIFLSSCHKEKSEGYKFSWTKIGTKLYYDYYTNNDTLKDYRLLTVGTLHTTGFFVEEAPASPFPSSFPLLFHILENEFKIKKDGLYGIACKYCRGLCLSDFEFLYAPNQPSLNQKIPVYGCDANIYYNNTIIARDTVVIVPWGTFKTYVMRHSNGDKSYWNPDEGLIMYETTANNSKGTLKLNRIVR